MELLKLLAFFTAVLIGIATLLPWYTLDTIHLSANGFGGQVTNDKPGIPLILLAFLYALFIFFDKRWTKLFALLFAILCLGFSFLVQTKEITEGISLKFGLILEIVLSAIAIALAFLLVISHKTKK